MKPPTDDKNKRPHNLAEAQDRLQELAAKGPSEPTVGERFLAGGISGLVGAALAFPTLAAISGMFSEGRRVRIGDFKGKIKSTTGKMPSRVDWEDVTRQTMLISGISAAVGGMAATDLQHYRTHEQALKTAELDVRAEKEHALITTSPPTVCTQQALHMPMVMPSRNRL